MEIHQAGDTVYIQLNTHQADGTPITWAGSPAVAVVKDGGTTTETDGVSLTVDAGTVTGRHIITIDTSQDGTFFATGHKFSVIVTAGTVDSVSTVGVIVAEFELGEVPANVKAWNGGALPVPAEAGDAMTLTEAYDAAKNGSETCNYTVYDTDGVTPLSGVKVEVTTGEDGSGHVTTGWTNAFGIVTFKLDPGTYYLWRSRFDRVFVDPDTEVVE